MLCKINHTTKSCNYMSEFHSPYNVPISIEERWNDNTFKELFIRDCLWIFHYNGFYEFYYNPCHFIGKVAETELPKLVIDRIKSTGAYFNSTEVDRKDYYARTEPTNLVYTSIRLRNLESQMRIGNWFYAQGQNYVTWRDEFICDDVYVENVERKCSIQKITFSMVYDMLRMSSRSKTPNYIKHLFEFDIFRGIDCSSINILPFNCDSTWNAESWADRFKGIAEDANKKNNILDRNALRTMRIDVFNDTVAAVRRGYYATQNGTIRFDESTTRAMIENTIFYDKEFFVDNNKKTTGTKISVVNCDCLVEAEKLVEMGMNVAVLNMASRRNPGGGVTTGAGAQEENIFRRTNIFQSLYQFAHYANLYGVRRNEKQYPLDRNFGGIYSSDVTVFRGPEDEGYPLLDNPFHVAFISVAALNRPELTSDNKIIQSLIDPTKRKMRTILRIALANGHDAIVLGAFGCGAFRNPPAHIAALFHEVLKEEEFHNKFKHISFSILEDHNSGNLHNPNGNFKPFYDEFSSTH